MAVNEILPFAQGPGTPLVQTQATYSAEAERLIGNQPGVARAEFVNKTLRQTAAISAGLGQFLATYQASNVTDALTPAALETIIVNAIKSLTAIPAGVVIFIPGTTALPNTLKCNGALVSRATYARLWTYAQASGNIAASDAAWSSATGMFSPGDGSTTFRMPDYRGYVIRGLDESRGVDSGRVIGSMQADQNLSHNHGIVDPGHHHDYRGAVIAPGGPDPSGINGTFSLGNTTDSQTGITIQNNGGSEARMKNIAAVFCIFY